MSGLSGFVGGFIGRESEFQMLLVYTHIHMHLHLTTPLLQTNLLLSYKQDDFFNIIHTTHYFIPKITTAFLKILLKSSYSLLRNFKLNLRFVIKMLG